MSQDAPHSQDGSRERKRYPRWLKYTSIGACLVGLALVPQWLFLGFRDAPALAGVAEIGDEESESFQPISWEVLGGFPYPFEMPGAIRDMSPEALAERNERLIPPEVRALDRLPIAVRGYVVPITVTRGRITEFVLAAKNELGCCFGSGLSMNQWIHVAVQEGRASDVKPFGIAKVLGVLEVGEEVRGGTVMSLYRMREATVGSG
ncbi:MAG: DUF3299 domain-containing protein [Myxococcota bacterium]|nr:DUF3299 domain-containing protein [Myxococcota bacterium]